MNKILALVGICTSLIITTKLYANIDSLSDGIKYCSSPSQECFDHQPMKAYQIVNPEQRDSKVALLVHGLSDSPYYMKDVATSLYNNGYSVRSILLSGHGTDDPRNLNNTKAKHWVKDIKRGLEVARSLGNKITLVGFSTGGSLLSNYIAKAQLEKTDTRDIQNLVLISPALHLLNPDADKVCLVSSVTFGLLYTGSNNQESLQVRYPEYPFEAACQLHKYLNQKRVTKNIQKLNNQKSNIPILAIYAGDDDDVDILETDKLLKQLSSNYTSALFGKVFSEEFRVKFQYGNYEDYRKRRNTFKPDLRIAENYNLEHTTPLLKTQGKAASHEVNPVYSEFEDLVLQFTQ